MLECVHCQQTVKGSHLLNPDECIKNQQTIEFDFCYTTQSSNAKTEMNSGAPEVIAFHG